MKLELTLGKVERPASFDISDLQYLRQFLLDMPTLSGMNSRVSPDFHLDNFKSTDFDIGVVKELPVSITLSKNFDCYALYSALMESGYSIKKSEIFPNQDAFTQYELDQIGLHELLMARVRSKPMDANPATKESGALK